MHQQVTSLEQALQNKLFIFPAKLDQRLELFINRFLSDIHCLHIFFCAFAFCINNIRIYNQPLVHDAKILLIIYKYNFTSTVGLTPPHMIICYNKIKIIKISINFATSFRNITVLGWLINAIYIVIIQIFIHIKFTARLIYSYIKIFISIIYTFTNK